MVRFQEIRFLAIASDAVIEDADEAAIMWDDARTMQKLAKEIQELLPNEVQDLEQDDVVRMIEDIHECARDMANLLGQADAHSRWRSACERIVSGTRRVQELLQQLPFLEVAVVPSNSEVFTHPTVYSPSHSSGSATPQETWTQGEAEDEDSGSAPWPDLEAVDPSSN
eukprot:Skav219608  [mRNA]  locus=scaffold628:79491:79994:- [translate_table: standard]